MKVGILLSGCGVYDGAEIQESVLTMLALDEIGAEYICISIDAPQHHVINHLTGEEMPESRNMMIESARIARGDVKSIKDIQPADIDGLVIPGGFGSAKNFTKWAFNGPEGTILPEVKLLLVNLVNVGKPIVGLCVSPVVIAKALEGSNLHSKMTLGSIESPSPYDIQAMTNGMTSTGVVSTFKELKEIEIDKENRIITAPCYMMEASILDIRKNIRTAIEAMRDLIG